MAQRGQGRDQLLQVARVQTLVQGLHGGDGVRGDDGAEERVIGSVSREAHPVSSDV